MPNTNSTGQNGTPSGSSTTAIIVSSVSAVLLALAVWRWYVTKRNNEKLLLDIQEMGEIAQYEEPLLSIAPEPLKKVAVTEMGGLVTDLVMIGGGAFGTQRTNFTDFR